MSIIGKKGCGNMIKICYCGDTIKRPLHDPDYCSSFCRTWSAEGRNWREVRLRDNFLSLKCLWCGDNHTVRFGDRHDKVYCSHDCSRQAREKSSWLLFNYCRVLSHHPDGLGAAAIARLLDEYAFNQTPTKVGSNMKKLLRNNVVQKTDGRYQLTHPNACGKVWLSCH